MYESYAIINNMEYIPCNYKVQKGVQIAKHLPVHEYTNLEM